jgi:hypothetical protein
VRQWWLLPLGLGIVAAALFALLSGGPSQLPVASGPPPLDDHDERSRQELERVLREADAESAR